MRRQHPLRRGRLAVLPAVVPAVVAVVAALLGPALPAAAATTGLVLQPVVQPVGLALTGGQARYTVRVTSTGTTANPTAGPVVVRLFLPEQRDQPGNSVVEVSGAGWTASPSRTSPPSAPAGTRRARWRRASCSGRCR